MASQSTAEYYRSNPIARKKRIEKQKLYNKTPNGARIAREATRLNRKLGTYGNGDGLDAAHYAGSRTEGRTLSASKNRASRTKRNKLKIVHHHV